MCAESRTFHQQPASEVMPITATLETREMVTRFIREDAPVYGGSQPATRALAHKLSVAPGTIKNAAAGRLKRICVDFFAALKREEMRRLNRAITKAEADLAMVRQIGLRADSPEYRTAEAAAMAARKIMEG